MSQEIVIEATNSTPLLVGWYKPEIADPSGLRATEIKGLWRYWARAVIGGVLYDQGLLSGEAAGEDIVIKPKKEETKAISCIVGRVLGLGYAGEEYSEASRFKIFVESRSPINIRSYPRGYRDHQRISLLTIDRSIQYITQGARFIIRIIRRSVSQGERDIGSLLKQGEDLALKIFLMTLQLSGFGKGGRRGLGSLDITSTRNLPTPRSLRDLLEDIYTSATKIVSDPSVSKLCRKLSARASSVTLPPMPVLSKKLTRDGVNVASVYNISINFRDIHNFFLRSHRCRVLTGDPACFDDIRNNYVGWFLGMPREQRGLGYKIEAEGISRRASPIYVTYHERGNIFGGGAFVTISLSLDWPREIVWDSKIININESEILRAYQIVWRELEDYLRRLGAGVRKVWP